MVRATRNTKFEKSPSPASTQKVEEEDPAITAAAAANPVNIHALLSSSDDEGKSGEESSSGEDLDPLNSGDDDDEVNECVDVPAKVVKEVVERPNKRKAASPVHRATDAVEEEDMDTGRESAPSPPPPSTSATQEGMRRLIKTLSDLLEACGRAEEMQGLLENLPDMGFDEAQVALARLLGEINDVIDQVNGGFAQIKAASLLLDAATKPSTKPSDRKVVKAAKSKVVTLSEDCRAALGLTEEQLEALVTDAKAGIITDHEGVWEAIAAFLDMLKDGQESITLTKMTGEPAELSPEGKAEQTMMRRIRNFLTQVANLIAKKGVTEGRMLDILDMISEITVRLSVTYTLAGNNIVFVGVNAKGKWVCVGGKYGLMTISTIRELIAARQAEFGRMPFIKVDDTLNGVEIAAKSDEDNIESARLRKQKKAKAAAAAAAAREDSDNDNDDEEDQ